MVNEKLKKQLQLIVIFIVLGFIFAWTYMQVHEQVHTAILRSYGIGTVVQVSWLSASTTPINQTQYEQNCNSDCILANNMTDPFRDLNPFQA